MALLTRYGVIDLGQSIWQTYITMYQYWIIAIDILWHSIWIHFLEYIKDIDCENEWKITQKNYVERPNTVLPHSWVKCPTHPEIEVNTPPPPPKKKKKKKGDPQIRGSK